MDWKKSARTRLGVIEPIENMYGVSAPICMLRIVGIMLVQNDDLYVGRAVRNSINFCDEFIVANHRSLDQTAPILSTLAAEFPEKLKLVHIDDPRESHALIKGFANSNTWLFAVDGDEVYDPTGLAQMRSNLLSGQYCGSWQVFGNVLNCVEIDNEKRTARGYMAPPSRSMTKLFNFRLIESWDGDTSHACHRGTIRFNPGFDASLRLNLHEQYSWERSPFRCLHACFVKRSTLQSSESIARQNVSERRRWGPIISLKKTAYRLLGKELPSTWKQEKYRLGPIVTVDTGAFLLR